VTIKQAIASFLMSCKVEGKSYGTIDCYTDKLKGFLRLASNESVTETGSLRHNWVLP
jgi:hypothetical protein